MAKKKVEKKVLKKDAAWPGSKAAEQESTANRPKATRTKALIEVR